VGDPLTLTLEVTGGVSISNMRTPVLGLQPELTKDFRVYDENVKSETLSNGKRFTYQIRPLREGTLEFPPVKIGYYNSETRAYEILTTQPIPIQAKATTQIVTITTSEEEKRIQEEQELLPCGITVVPLAGENDTLLPSAQALLLLLFAGPFVCLLVVLATPFRRFVGWIRAFNRTTGALRRAHSACRNAKNADSLSQAVRCYLAERLGLASGTALTPGEAGTILLSRGVPDELAHEIQTHLAQLDEAMYRPDAELSMAESKKALTEILTRLDKEVGK
jgi:hypothetical protein